MKVRRLGRPAPLCCSRLAGVRRVVSRVRLGAMLLAGVRYRRAHRPAAVPSRSGSRSKMPAPARVMMHTAMTRAKASTMAEPAARTSAGHNAGHCRQQCGSDAHGNQQHHLSFVPKVAMAKFFIHAGVKSMKVDPTDVSGEATGPKNAETSWATANRTPAEMTPGQGPRQQLSASPDLPCCRALLAHVRILRTLAWPTAFSRWKYLLVLRSQTPCRIAPAGILERLNCLDFLHHYGGCGGCGRAAGRLHGDANMGCAAHRPVEHLHGRGCRVGMVHEAGRHCSCCGDEPQLIGLAFRQVPACR